MDTQIALFNLNSKKANLEETQKFKHAEVVEIMAKQGKQIEKLETQCEMLYQLVLSLSRSSSHQNPSIGSAPSNPVEEKTVQQAQEGQQQQAESNQEAHSGHAIL